MNILYVITILAIYTVLMLIHKTEKKQNIIMWITISTILILCYNVLICTLFSFLGILCTLLNLSITNIIIILVLSIFGVKKKKVQKYYVKISDIVFSILLLVIVIFIAYEQYGFPFNIKYDSTDSASHYFFAEQFYKNAQLLNIGETEDQFGMYLPQYRLPAAYVNEGIIFKIFDGIISKTDLFIIFDLCILYMSAILFYYSLKKYVKDSKKLNVIAIVFTLIYMLGYQLNSVITGFVYLTLGLDIVLTLMLVLSNYEKEEISNIIIIPILTLLSFGVFFSYAYFVPIVYVAIIANKVVKSIQRKEEMTSLENIIKLIIVIAIPLIIGLIYFLLLPVMNKRASEIETIGKDGGIYRNYITNVLVFIPIIVTGLILKIKNKNKEIDFGTVLFSTSILFLIILLVGRTFRLVSNYYYFKVYFIIWPLVIYNAFIALTNILVWKNKPLRIVTYSYISIYIVALVVASILNKNIGINDIFYHNLRSINEYEYTFYREEIDFLEKSSKTIEVKDLYVSTQIKDIGHKWMYAICKNPFIYADYSFRNEGTIERWLKLTDRKYYAALCRIYDQFIDKEEIDANSDKYNIIYEDEYGFVLERK